jgi:hypothetical protein
MAQDRGAHLNTATESQRVGARVCNPQRAPIFEADRKGHLNWAHNNLRRTMPLSLPRPLRTASPRSAARSARLRDRFIVPEPILTGPRDRIQFAKAGWPWGKARGRECIRCDTRPTEQRRPGANRPWPEGLRRFWLGALWRLRSQRGGSAPLGAPSSKPKTTQQTVFYPAVRSVGQ